MIEIFTEFIFILGVLVGILGLFVPDNISEFVMSLAIYMMLVAIGTKIFY